MKSQSRKRRSCRECSARCWERSRNRAGTCSGAERHPGETAPWAAPCVSNEELVKGGGYVCSARELAR